MNDSRRTKAASVVGEAVTIVFSVLLALGLDAWWDQRTDSLREQAIKAELAQEFLVNRERLERDVGQNKGLVRATEALLAIGAEDLEALPPDSATSLVRQSLQMATFDPATAIMSSVMMAGEVSLISNPDLRTALASWSDGLVELRRVQDGASYWHTNYIFPEVFGGTRREDAQNAGLVLSRFEVHLTKHRMVVNRGERLLAITDTVLAHLAHQEKGAAR